MPTRPSARRTAPKPALPKAQKNLPPRVPAARPPVTALQIPDGFDTAPARVQLAQPPVTSVPPSDGFDPSLAAVPVDLTGASATAPESDDGADAGPPDTEASSQASTAASLPPAISVVDLTGPINEVASAAVREAWLETLGREPDNAGPWHSKAYELASRHISADVSTGEINVADGALESVKAQLVAELKASPEYQQRLKDGTLPKAEGAQGSGEIDGAKGGGTKVDREAIAELVNSTYREVLGREGDPTGVASWTEGALKRAEAGESMEEIGSWLKGQFEGSDEAAANRARTAAVTDLVKDTYRQVLGREGEPAGVAGWTQNAVKRVAAGESMESVGAWLKAQFETSAEAKTNRANAAVDQLVVDGYRKFLGREAEPAGLKAWQGTARQKLAEGATVEQVALWIERGLRESEEGKAYAARTPPRPAVEGAPWEATEVGAPPLGRLATTSSPLTATPLVANSVSSSSQGALPTLNAVPTLATPAAAPVTERVMNASLNGPTVIDAVRIGAAPIPTATAVATGSSGNAAGPAPAADLKKAVWAQIRQFVTV